MFKIDKNNKYFTISLYAVAILAITILTVLVGLNFSAIKALWNRFTVVTSPILIGLIIAYFCNPIMSFFENKALKFKSEKKLQRSLKRILAILLAYVCVISVITLMLFLTIPKILENYEVLIEQVTDVTVKIVNRLDEILKSFNIENIDETIYGAGEKLIEYIGTQIANWSGKLLITLVKIFIGCILSFYILLKKEVLISYIKKHSAALLPRRLFAFIYKVTKVSHKAFGKYFIGSVFDSILIGFMTFLICWILKFPYYSVVSVIVCITNIIPYFGPFLGAIPSFIIIFISEPIKAFWFIVIILVLQQIDGNIIAPRILGNAVGLSSLWVIIAVTIMGGFFGLVGMIIGIPLFSIFYTLISDFVNDRLRKKNMPTELSAYDDVFTFTSAKIKNASPSIEEATQEEDGE